MYKLGHLVGDSWLEHSHPPVFVRREAPSGTDRLEAGVPAGDPQVMQRLVACLEEPFDVLYVLHTSRGEAEVGRYQSPPLDHAALRRLFDDYGDFLRGDGRFDLWVRSEDSDTQLVWDRHNILFAYGALDLVETELSGLGFSWDQPLIPGSHCHFYRSELDGQARSLLAAFDWYRTPLRPEDEQ